MGDRALKFDLKCLVAGSEAAGKIVDLTKERILSADIRTPLLQQPPAIRADPRDRERLAFAQSLFHRNIPLQGVGQLKVLGKGEHSRIGVRRRHSS